jgi:hypothetical protein
MAVLVEMHHTGDPALRADVVARIEHALADRPGDYRVSIVGSQANDRWEMKITGPNGFERSYTLEGRGWLSFRQCYAPAAVGAAGLGLMLWFMRKRFVGSYLFFKTTRRS